MATITRSSFPRSLVPGVLKKFGDSYKMGPKEYAEVFDLQRSDKAYEDIVSETGFAPAQAKGETDSIVYDSSRQGFETRLTNVTMALGFQISMEAKNDSKFLPEAPKKAERLAKSFYNAKETVGALILSRAFNSSYKGADGLELCSTAHLNKSGGTFSNELATPADISEAAIEALVNQVWLAEDDRGKIINLSPKALIVSTADSWDAHRILKSVLQNDTANNAVNALRDKGIIPKVVMNRYYNAGDGAWFIKTDADCGLIYQERQKLIFGMDDDSDTLNTKFTGYERYTFGWADPRGVYGSAGA